MKKKIYYMCLAVLLAVVIFKLWANPFERGEELLELRRIGYDNVNSTPLYTVKICLKNFNTPWGCTNLIGNIIPFFAFGIITRIAWRKYTCCYLFFVSASIIAFCEIVQYVCLLGVCDIDDIIINFMFINFGIYFAEIIDFNGSLL